MLDGEASHAGSFDKILRDAIKSRAARGLIRKVHLRGPDVDLLTSIIASLTPDDNGIRPSNIESIFLTHVDGTKFFARYRFPKLRDLSLFECSDFALDHLKSSTNALTNLSLRDNMSSPPSIPSTSQLLSLLSSNPYLQTITLYILLISDDIRSDCRLRVPLPHLKRFSLTMDFRRALAVLHRLEFPHMPNQLNLCFRGCTLEVARQVVGPYIRDRIQGDPRSKNRLGISVSSTFSRVSLEVSVVDVGYRYPDQLPTRSHLYATFTMTIPRRTSREERDKLCTILALLPRERVVYLATNLSTGLMEELLVAMPNIEGLYLTCPAMFEWFLLPDPYGPNAHKKLLPSLKCLYLEAVAMEDEGWDPLVRYLAHQTSADQRITLSVFGEGIHVCSDVRDQIRGLVERFLYSPDPDQECPFDCCSDYSD